MALPDCLDDEQGMGTITCSFFLHDPQGAGDGPVISDQSEIVHGGLRAKIKGASIGEDLHKAFLVEYYEGGEAVLYESELVLGRKRKAIGI